MIPVKPQPEPKAPDYDFKSEVYDLGRDTILQLIGKPPLKKRPGQKIKQRVKRRQDITPEMLRKYPRWTKAIPSLHRAYDGYCAYQARYFELTDNPTTDHFIALANAGDPQLAYDWSNFRLACTRANSCKGTKTILDPFKIEEGWFALDLSDFKTIVGPEAPKAKHDDIARTIKHLGLNHADVILMRRRAAENYWEPPAGRDPLPFWDLERTQPFVASELKRQGRLRSEDM